MPVLAIAAQIPAVEIGGEYFQETHPAELFRECSVYCELVSVPEQLPRILQIAMRTALARGGVAVVVAPGEIFLAHAAAAAEPAPVRAISPVIRPDDQALAAAAQVLNAASRVTILAGAGCAGAHDQLIGLAEALKAPVVHAFRGKEFVEYDNPYDVGMTGLKWAVLCSIRRISTLARITPGSVWRARSSCRPPTARRKAPARRTRGQALLLDVEEALVDEFVDAEGA